MKMILFYVGNPLKKAAGLFVPKILIFSLKKSKCFPLLSLLQTQGNDKFTFLNKNLLSMLYILLYTCGAPFQ